MSCYEEILVLLMTTPPQQQEPLPAPIPSVAAGAIAVVAHRLAFDIGAMTTWILRSLQLLLLLKLPMVICAIVVAAKVLQ